MKIELPGIFLSSSFLFPLRLAIGNYLCDVWVDPLTDRQKEREREEESAGIGSNDIDQQLLCDCSSSVQSSIAVL